MIIITVEHKAQIAEVSRRMDLACLQNCNLGNVDYEIEVGDFNCIDGIDALVGASLMNVLFGSEEINVSSRYCPALLDIFFDGQDDEQILDALNDGEYLGNTDLTLDEVEDLHAFIKARIKLNGG